MGKRRERTRERTKKRRKRPGKKEEKRKEKREKKLVGESGFLSLLFLCSFKEREWGEGGGGEEERGISDCS